MSCLVIALLAVLSGVGWNALHLDRMPMLGGDGDIRVAAMALVLSAAVLFYFNWRYRVLSPALSEARLFALQARIRPHFLFNSLNTVLGLIRAEPRQAETVLENLSELFRALMSESQILVPLAKEIALAKAYLEVEAIRLGGRLSVNWQCQSAPQDALVPPLMLQPLLENAVYHGIEPAEAGGEVNVTIFAKDKHIHLVVRNPVCPGRERRSGNRMALNNIRERLDLHFDADASMRYYEAGDEFVVQIRMPYKHGQST
jgi:two-component system sensor histidine kinase AlgZ